MFKFLVLSALVAVAVAAPSHGWYNQHSSQHYQHHEPEQVVVYHQQPAHEYAHVGSVVKHYPVATSHQSRTDYHSKPVVKTILAPVEYVQPIVHHQEPIVHHHEPIVHHHEPIVHHAHHEPTIVYSSLPEIHQQQHHQIVESIPVQHVQYGSVQHYGSHGHHHEASLPVVHSSW